MVPPSARIWSSQPLDERSFMKFVSLRRKGAHRQSKLDKPPRAMVESVSKPMAISHEIHTYAELRQQIHDALRTQHPEWVQPNGECPVCDSYEARLMEELETFTRTGSDETVADISSRARTWTKPDQDRAGLIAPPHEKTVVLTSCWHAGYAGYCQRL
jgi:hypothetical protein